MKQIQNIIEGSWKTLTILFYMKIAQSLKKLLKMVNQSINLYFKQESFVYNISDMLTVSHLG